MGMSQSAPTDRDPMLILEDDVGGSKGVRYYEEIECELRVYKERQGEVHII